MTKTKIGTHLVNASTPEALAVVRELKEKNDARVQAHRDLHERHQAEHEAFDQEARAERNDLFSRLYAALGLDVDVATNDSGSLDVEYLESLGFAVLKDQPQQQYEAQGIQPMSFADLFGVGMQDADEDEASEAPLH